MMVTRAAGGYVFVKDPWSGGNTLLVYAPGAAIERWWSELVDGYTATVRGQRIVVATRVRLYMCANGRPFILMPKHPKEPADWPWMREIPLGLSLMDAEPPPVPEEEQEALPGRQGMDRAVQHEPRALCHSERPVCHSEHPVCHSERSEESAFRPLRLPRRRQSRFLASLEMTV